MENNKYAILGHLTQAISQLEKAVVAARQTIENKPSYPLEAMVRLDSYMDIVEAQRKELPEIAIHIANSDLTNLSAAVKRVNALSALVREDAKELISILSNPSLKPIRPEPN